MLQKSKIKELVKQALLVIFADIVADQYTLAALCSRAVSAGELIVRTTPVILLVSKTSATSRRLSCGVRAFLRSLYWIALEAKIATVLVSIP